MPSCTWTRLLGTFHFIFAHLPSGSSLTHEVAETSTSRTINKVFTVFFIILKINTVDIERSAQGYLLLGQTAESFTENLAALHDVDKGVRVNVIEYRTQLDHVGAVKGDI